MTIPSSRLRSQRGGITILVALMLLVLLTIAAVGMSRNSFREVVASGTTRQGAMARNVADSGIEWSVLYINPANTATTDSGKALQSLARTLLEGNIYGLAYDVKSQTAITSLPNTATPPADLQVPAGSGNGVNLALTCMGKMSMPGTAQTAGSPGSGYTPAAGSPALTAPDLWALRSDGQITAGPVTFTHSKEAWVSTPATR